jgi:hypothetical protein
LLGSIPAWQCLRVYRSVFLLNRLNDAALGKLFIPAAKSLLLIFYINVPAFVVIRYWDQLDIISISTLIFVFGSALSVILTCSNVMSGIYNISSQFQKNMEHKIQACEDKAMKEVMTKQLLSCQVIRFQIGNFYHMEGKAKLTLINTMVNVFVFMIVQRSKQ